MAYLAGWMAFDASEHRPAQRYFTLAAKLAAEAGDGPLAGHILRAMAHQAVDLGHPRQALDLASASMDPKRYGRASRARRHFWASSTPGPWQPRATAAAPSPRSAAPNATSAATPETPPTGSASSPKHPWRTRPPAPCATSATPATPNSTSNAASPPDAASSTPAPTA